MADAKDILGVRRKNSSAAPLNEKNRNTTESHKKPDGMSRELFQLTGGLPPVIPSVGAAHIKKKKQQKAHEPRDPDTKMGWRMVPFTSSARVDNLALHHWERLLLEKEASCDCDITNGGEGPGTWTSPTDLDHDGRSRPFPQRATYRIAAAPPRDYLYAKFNKKVEVIRYTDKEYAAHLVDDTWTKEETDALFDLCEQFDLRFIIIADRFPTCRTVEELRNRYYSSAKLILEKRSGSDDEIANHPLVTTAYDYNYEVRRKNALGIVLSQTRRQQAEDNKVLEEARRITERRQKEKHAKEQKEAANHTATKRKQSLSEEDPDAVKEGVTTREDLDLDSSAEETTNPHQPPTGADAQDSAELVKGDAANVEEVLVNAMPSCSIKPPTRSRRLPPAQPRASALAAKITGGSSVSTTGAETPGPEASDSGTATTYTQSTPSNYALQLMSPGVYLQSKLQVRRMREFSSQVGRKMAKKVNQWMNEFAPRLKMPTSRACMAHMELRRELQELFELEGKIKSLTAPKKPPRAETDAAVGAAGTSALPAVAVRVGTRERRRSVRMPNNK
ncbi:hypothetical protein R1flu_001336 [Riccia fluitans]|uniref:Myb-like domain-containing protein n=1 Tax=Riccia fluitans TaxID=41844 RepID=A0ABD1Y305_9MARC